MRWCSLAFLVACGAPELAPAPPPQLAATEFEEAAPRWIGFLQRYLAIDTTNPPGNEARAFPLLTEGLRSVGLTSSVTALGPDRGNVWAILEATNPEAPPLVLLHHIDVVPIEAEHWTAAPFAGELKDGLLYGRGAIDTKVLGVLQLAALERLAKQRDRLRRNVIFLAVSDEERGGTGAQWVVENQLPLWKPEYLLDEGGFAIRDFMNSKDLLVIATGQKRVAKLKLVAQGQAGHGSRPIPNSGPAILIEALHRLHQNPPELRLTPLAMATFQQFGHLAGYPKGWFLQRLDWPGFLGALEGTLTSNKNLNPMLRDTLSVTIIQTGNKENVIPAEATAILDVRLLPDTDSEAFLDRLKTLCEGLSVTFEYLEPVLPPVPIAPTADPLFEALVAASRAHEPQSIVAPWLMIGANDSRFFAPKGVKTYGFMPAYLTKAQIDGIHGHDEHLAVAELERAFVVYAEALERFLLR